MTESATFTRPTAERIIRATRAVEAEQMRTAGSRIPGPRPTFSAPISVVEVVVRNRDFTSESKILTVTPIIETDDEPHFAKKPDGTDLTREMWVWHGLRVKHYAALAQPTGEEPDPMKILPAIKIGKKMRVWQLVRWSFPLQEERFKVEGCLPVVTP